MQDDTPAQPEPNFEIDSAYGFLTGSGARSGIEGTAMIWRLEVRDGQVRYRTPFGWIHRFGRGQFVEEYRQLRGSLIPATGRGIRWEIVMGERNEHYDHKAADFRLACKAACGIEGQTMLFEHHRLQRAPMEV